MLGLALMASELAERRVGYGPMSEGFTDLGSFITPRRHMKAVRRDPCFGFSREYYAICDRIARGKKA